MTKPNYVCTFYIEFKTRMVNIKLTTKVVGMMNEGLSSKKKERKKRTKKASSLTNDSPAEPSPQPNDSSSTSTSSDSPDTSDPTIIKVKNDLIWSNLFKLDQIQELKDKAAFSYTISTDGVSASVLFKIKVKKVDEVDVKKTNKRSKGNDDKNRPSKATDPDNNQNEVVPINVTGPG